MAQTGYTPILIYASGTPTNVPLAANLTSSASGAELALNYADGKLYFKNSSGVVTLLAGSGGGGPAAGSNTQVQFNNNGVFGASANMTFNGTRLTVADLADSGLTATRVVYSTTGGALTDSANLTFDGTNLTLGGGVANGVAYLNGSKVLTTGSALTFDGTNLGVGMTPSAWASNRSVLQLKGGVTTGGAFLASGAAAQALLGTNSFSNGTNFIYLSTGARASLYDQSSGAHAWLTSPSGTAGNAITFTTAMLLDEGGRLYVGTTGSQSSARVVSAGSLALQAVNGSPEDQFPSLEFYNNNSSGFLNASISATVGTTINSGNITFNTNNSGTFAERARISQAGNFGLGVIPNASMVGQGMQIRNGFFGSLGGPNTHVYVSANAVPTGNGDEAFTTWRYLNTGEASRFDSRDGIFRWFTAPSGTAGNAISFTQAMRLTAGGEWNIDGGTGSGRITLTPQSGTNVLNSTTTNFATYNIFRTVASAHQWFVGPSTQAMTLTAGGDLAIGTTLSNGRLTVFGPTQTIVRVKGGAGTNQGSAIYFENAGNSNTLAAFGDTAGIFGGTPDASVSIFTGGGVPLVFAAGAGERARIDSSGNLLVGTTSGSNRLTVATTAQAAAILCQNSRNVSGDFALVTELGSNCANTSSYHIISSTGGADRFYVFGNGNVQNQNNSYGALSDAKLKENVTDATPKLEKLNQVRVVNYNLIGETQKQIGVIAQELEQIFPGMIDESPDRDAEGNDLGTTTKSVKYSVFVPMLIKAIQEQQAIITQLKARLDAANL